MDELIINLDVGEGPPRFRLIRTLLGGDAAKKWNTVAANIAPQDADKTQVNFERCIEDFLLTYMDREISLDTKEWFQVIKKPKKLEDTKPLGSKEPTSRKPSNSGKGKEQSKPTGSRSKTPNKPSSSTGSKYCIIHGRGNHSTEVLKTPPKYGSPKSTFRLLFTILSFLEL